jgi:hypothetical protein
VADRRVAQRSGWASRVALQPRRASDQVEIEFEGRKLAVTPQTLSGEDRAAAWERITRERPNFAGYEQKTDREIPVAR